MPSAAVRFRRPLPIDRQGTNGFLVVVWVECYGAPTNFLVELAAYNSAGQRLPGPFTDSDSIVASGGGGSWNGSGYNSTYSYAFYMFDNTTIAAQAVYMHSWLFVGGYVIDIV